VESMTSSRTDQLTLDPRDHVVEFYGADDELAAPVSSYLGEGLKAGGSAVVMASAAHQLAFAAELVAAGIDVGAAQAAGRLLMLDASESLHGFLSGDRLDRARFDSAIGGLIRRAATTGPPVCVYGEMVALLWDGGHVNAALELEELWNDLASGLPFSLWCAYPARLAAGAGNADAVEQVCRLHSSVIGSQPGRPGEVEVPGPGSDAVRGFPQAREAPRAARHFVVDTLGSWGDQALAGDAAIVIAELAANAVIHARSDFTVSVSRHAAGVRISVLDASPMSSMNGGAALVASHGHGLGVVARLASKWAVEPLPGGKVVWADLPALS